MVGTSRKIGSAWEIVTPAKLNLYLEVVGPRTKGFHPLETLMVPVRIFDQLYFRNSRLDSSEPRLRVRNLMPGYASNAEPIGASSDNLVLKAVDKLAQVAGVEPHGSFELVKRIPIQAGMGGGSSDAAAALMLMNEAWGIRYSQERLIKIAAELGSDVPFFLGLGPAICRGRGELVEPVEGLPRLHFVVVKPPVGLSTPKVFEQLSAMTELSRNESAKSSERLNALLNALRIGAISDAGQFMVNRLEAAAEQLSSWIAKLRNMFAQLDCWAHMMTGSGTAYVGVMRSARQARRAARLLASKLNEGPEVGSVFATSSC